MPTRKKSSKEGGDNKKDRNSKSKKRSLEDTLESKKNDFKTNKQDDDDDEEEEEVEDEDMSEKKIHKSKTRNLNLGQQEEESIGDVSGDTAELIDASRSKTKSKVNKNKDGSYFFDLSLKRRLTIRYYQQNILFDIREHFVKDGEVLPTKKGISLNLDQFNALRTLIQDRSIDDVIHHMKKVKCNL